MCSLSVLSSKVMRKILSQEVLKMSPDAFLGYKLEQFILYKRLEYIFSCTSGTPLCKRVLFFCTIDIIT